MSSPLVYSDGHRPQGEGNTVSEDLTAGSPLTRPRSLVVVSVGTDHHPFDRLVGCMDRWAADHPTVQVIIQRGSAAETEHAESRVLIPHSELLNLFSMASAVVTHGGPSTIMDVRAAGLSPIVFPRDPDHGEHVDNHQLRFGQHLARHQMAAIVYDSQDLAAAVNEALIAPERYRITTNSEPAPGVVAFGRVVDELLGINTDVRRPDRLDNPIVEERRQ